MSLRLIAFGRTDVLDANNELIPVYEPKVFMLYEANDSVGSTGQTAAFNWWCEQIALKLFGLDLTKIKNNPDQFEGAPFYELLSYPSGKGSFGLSVCRKLAQDFNDPVYQNRAISSDSTGGTGFKMGYDKWTAAFAWAASNGGYLSFGMGTEAIVPNIMKITSNGYLVPEPLDNNSILRLRQRQENQARLVAPKTEIFNSSPDLHPVIATEPVIVIPQSGEALSGGTAPVVVNPDPTRPVTRLPITPEMAPVAPENAPVVTNPVTVIEPIPFEGEVIAAAPLQPRGILTDVPVAPVVSPPGAVYKPGDIIKIRVLDKKTGRNTPITGTVTGFAPNGDLIIATPDGPLIAALSPASLKVISELYQEKPHKA